MKDSYLKGLIVSNEEVSPGVYSMELRGDFKGEAGQFYMLRGWENLDPFLPRPISICDIDRGTLRFLYLKKGRGTDLLAGLRPEDSISLLGPLGNGFDLDSLAGKKVALVGGGIGIAPLLKLAKDLKGPDIYLGFKDQAYLVEEFSQLAGNFDLATEEGGQGKKGFVTDLFKAEDYDYVLACGPTAMLKALKAKCQDRTELIISMESRMACGIGACMGCSIETENGMKRVCKDGPVFKAREVIFND